MYCQYQKPIDKSSMFLCDKLGRNYRVSENFCSKCDKVAPKKRIITHTVEDNLSREKHMTKENAQRLEKQCGLRESKTHAHEKSFLVWCKLREIYVSELYCYECENGNETLFSQLTKWNQKPENAAPKPNPQQRFIFKDGFKVYDIQSCKYRGKELDDKKRACCGGKIQREIKFECRCKKIESGQAWSRQCLDCKHRRTKNAS